MSVAKQTKNSRHKTILEWLNYRFKVALEEVRTLCTFIDQLFLEAVSQLRIKAVYLSGTLVDLHVYDIYTIYITIYNGTWALDPVGSCRSPSRAGTPTHTRIYDTKPSCPHMSDCGLGDFPIAGPRYSSCSLERCHAVSVCASCPPAWGKEGGGGQQKQHEPLKNGEEKHCSLDTMDEPWYKSKISPTRQLTAVVCGPWWDSPRYSNPPPPQHPSNLSVSVGASTPWEFSDVVSLTPRPSPKHRRLLSSFHLTEGFLQSKSCSTWSTKKHQRGVTHCGSSLESRERSIHI